MLGMADDDSSAGSESEVSSNGEEIEHDEAVEGRRQARMLRKVLTRLEGSVLRAWRKAFDAEGDGRINEFQFVRLCRQVKFLGDPYLVFRFLDDDASGELTLEEVHKEQNDLWAAFVDFCAENFAGSLDMIQKLNGAGERRVSAKHFQEGLHRYGWTGGYELLLFDAVDLGGDGFIESGDLKWLDIQQKRAKIKRTARQRAMRDRKKQTWDPKLVMETLADFKKHLRRTYGSYLRAWRLVLSPNDSVTVSRTQFLTACSALGFKDAGKVLWRAFGRDELSPISLDFLDPESAEVLAHFQQLVQQLGGVSAAFRVFDKKDVKRIKMPEFISTLNSLDASLPAKQLFYGLDTDANGRLEIEDFKFLEKWKLPEFLIASPSEEAKEEVKRDLLVTYKTYLKAWRLALDENNSNRCTWPEFQSACRKVNFTGDVAGAWRALDTDLSGSITLQEVDYESSATLATFKKWADENFGGIRSAFMVFDADGSNGVTLREWRHACRIYGFHQGASSLFKQLDAEGVGSLSLDQVAFLDDWDFQPEKTAMSTTPSQHSPARTERKVAPGGFSQPQSPAAAGAKHKILRRPQGLALPSRVVWGELPCKRPRPPPRGPGTGLPRAWCCKCRARGPCRHFARADGVRSLAPSPRTAGYDALMSPDPLEPPAVKYSRYRWLRERIKPSTTRRPHTSPAVPGSDPRGCVRAEVEGEVSEDRPHELSIAFPDLANSQRSSDSLGAQVQLMALQHFPMGTWDFPLPFLASSPSRQLLLQAV
mmetsp:Transcript_50137/g.103579  ORF Transcript_50137/g.103579 Transcript_50137/m.103579 type:complete len:764 (+) Transcript_50137:90-2381(+)